MGPDGPKWGQEDVFPINQDLADILGDRDFDFEFFICFFLIFGHFSGPRKKWAQMGPNGPRRIFSY